jgi:hypothetical protein
MAKPEDRAVDSGVAQLRGKDDAAAVEWWKQRFALIAGIPTEVARAGALLPQMRELSRLPETERRRFTKLRMQAFTSVPSDQRQLVMSARKLTYAFDPALVKSDDDLVQQLVPEVPGAADIAQQMGQR